MKKSSIFFLIFLVSGCFGWYEVPTFSMEPTIMTGGKIKIEEDFYDTNPIQRFDIVGHIVPSDNLFQAKRIIGLSEETIEIKNGAILIDGQILEEPHEFDKIKKDFGPVVIPQNHYFLLGDNRNKSYDSRAWGTLPREAIRGKVVQIKNP